MSKSKGNTPNVEMRRRNNKPHTSTPSDELSQILSGRLEKDGGPIQIVESEPDEKPAAEFEAVSHNRQMSPQPEPSNSEALPVDDSLECAVKTNVDAQGPRNELYRAKNLVLILTRAASSLSADMNESIKSTLELFPQAIEGAARGFAINLDAKAVYEPTASSLRMAFDERSGRAIGKLFEKWGREIGRVGVGAHTTVDFLLVEPDATGRRVLDAWNCRGMFPAAMSTSHGARNLNGTRVHAPLTTSWNGNVQLMEDVAAAQAAFDDLIVASSSPFHAS
jgi:hypothetical protein